MSRASLPSLAAGIRRFDEFVFGPVDARVCAWLRMGFGFLVFLNFAGLAMDFELWFGEAGAVPYEAARSAIDPDTITLFTLLPRTGTGLLACAAIMLLQAFLLMIGWMSRFNAACVFIWLVSLQHRNHLLFDGEDVFFRLFALFLVFMPIGACWSVDAWRRRRLGKTLLPVEAAGSGWALRLLQIQLALIYLSSVWLKLDGKEWLDGSALWYVYRLDDVFGRMPLPTLLTDSAPILLVSGWLVILVEAFLVLALWFRETRWPALILGFGLHLALELTMNLFLFEWLMMLALTSHLRGEELARVVGSVKRLLGRKTAGVTVGD